MREGEPQRAIPAHRDPADSAIGVAFADAILRFDKRNKLLQEKITVPYFAVGRVDVKSSTAFRSGDQEFSDLVLLAKVVEQRPSTAIEQRALVIPQAMQKIKHRVGPR